MFKQHTSRIMCAVALTDLMAVSLIVPLAGEHLRSLGMSHFLIGLTGSIYAALQLFSSPIIGSWSDVRGHRFILILTMAVCSVCYLFWGFTSSVGITLLIRFILGIFKHTQTLCKALIADSVPPHEHSKAFGQFNAVSGLGFMIGPVIGGHLSELENGFFYVCCIVSLTILFNIALVFVLIPEQTSKTVEGKLTMKGISKDINCFENSLKSQMLSSFLLLKSIDWPQFWDIFVLKFLLGFSLAMFYSNYVLYINESFGIGSRWVGYTISFQGLIGATSSAAMGHLDKLYLKDPTYNVRMLHGFTVLSLSFCILGVAPNFNCFLIGLIPLSASGALLRVVGMEVLLQRTDVDKRGSIVGSSNSVSSIARLVAPVCAGLIHGYTSQGIFIVAMFISGAGTVLAYCLLPKGNHTKSL